MLASQGSLNLIDKYFWPTCAITLGVWESAALTTKKVPTITNTCYHARSKWRYRTTVVVGVWLVGLGTHLLKGVVDEVREA